MADLDQLKLDKYMIASNSPLNRDNSQTVVGADMAYDNALGAATFSTGRINAPITVGGKTGAAFLRIDGQNNRIVSNDGTVNRIIIGSV